MNPWPYPRIVAHRGGAALAPENTLLAFDQAAVLGHRCVECDVALTRDDQPVLLHDDTVDRTSDGHGQLADLTADDLARLDAGRWFHPRFAGTRIPRLDEAIACWQDHGQQALIELKLGAGRDPDRLGELVARTTLRCWRGAPPLLISFSVEALAAAGRAAPALPRALLLEAWPADWRQQAEAVGACAIDLAHPLADRDRIEAVHAAGFHLAVWTVNDATEAERLLRLGVDAVTTDEIGDIRP